VLQKKERCKNQQKFQAGLLPGRAGRYGEAGEKIPKILQHFTF